MKKKGRFFYCTSLFQVFFAPLGACTAQGGIWPSAAKAWFTPLQKAVYSLVGNIYVITLFPEHCTLQMNSNCLARYQYNELKGQKHIHQLLLPRDAILIGLSAGENGHHCPWPQGQFVLGLHSPVSQTDCTLSCPCGEALGAPNESRRKGLLCFHYVSPSSS